MKPLFFVGLTLISISIFGQSSTTSKAKGKIVQRSEYKAHIEANFKSVQQQPDWISTKKDWQL